MKRINKIIGFIIVGVVIFVLAIALTFFMTMHFQDKKLPATATVVLNNVDVVEELKEDAEQAIPVIKAKAVDVKEKISNIIQDAEETLVKMQEMAVAKLTADSTVQQPVTTLKIPDQVFSKGKNTALAIFDHMDSLDEILKKSLEKGENEVPDDMLERYRLTQIDRNIKTFRRDYVLTCLYVQNGGRWKEGFFISAFPPNWDMMPSNYDDVILDWKMVKHYEIYPSRPLQ